LKPSSRGSSSRSVESATSRFTALALSTEPVSSSDACTYTSHFTVIADSIAVPFFSVFVASKMGTFYARLQFIWGHIHCAYEGTAIVNVYLVTE
jgi:hypothetical protein